MLSPAPKRAGRIPTRTGPKICVLCLSRECWHAAPDKILTPREIEICKLLALGRRNSQIASALGISEGTVKVYNSDLFKKLCRYSRLEVALFVRENARLFA